MGIWVVSILAIMNNATVKIDVRVYVWTYLFISLGKYLGAESLGHRVTLCFTFEELPNYFQSICTILHSQRQCKGVPMSLHPHQHVLL